MPAGLNTLIFLNCGTHLCVFVLAASLPVKILSSRVSLADPNHTKDLVKSLFPPCAFPHLFLYLRLRVELISD